MPIIKGAGSQKDVRERRPQPKILRDVIFSDFHFIAEGTHAVVYKVTATRHNIPYTRYLKIFHKGWDTPYILETAAYAYLRRAGVEMFVLRFYGHDSRTPLQRGLSRIFGEEGGKF